MYISIGIPFLSYADQQRVWGNHSASVGSHSVGLIRSFTHVVEPTKLVSEHRPQIGHSCNIVTHYIGCQVSTVCNENKKASIRWQDSAPPISGCLSCNNRNKRFSISLTAAALWGEVCATHVLPIGVGPFAFRYQGNGVTPAILIPLERQLTALQLCRWQFLYNETLQQTSRPLLSKLSERRQI